MVAFVAFVAFVFGPYVLAVAVQFVAAPKVQDFLGA
jgi:hypothetical protein